MASTYLAAEVFSRLGIAEVEVRSLSCRQTTCQLSYEFPTRLEDVAVASGLPPGSPMVLVEEALGWAAPTGGGFHRTTFERDGQPYARISVVLGFDEGSWDPGQYRQWVHGQLPGAREFYRRYRESRRKPAAAAYGDAG